VLLSETYTLGDSLAIKVGQKVDMVKVLEEERAIEAESFGGVRLSNGSSVGCLRGDMRLLNGEFRFELTYSIDSTILAVEDLLRGHAGRVLRRGCVRVCRCWGRVVVRSKEDRLA
jgi:hypothetical protein